MPSKIAGIHSREGEVTSQYITHRDHGPFKCLCGEVFPHIGDLRIHMAMMNPYWPRVREDDAHKRVFGKMLSANLTNTKKGNGTMDDEVRAYQKRGE